MTRRALILGSAAGLLRADSKQQVYELIADLSACLSSGDPVSFLAHVDKATPGYERLTIIVTALLREYLIESSVDLNSNEGNDQARTVEADWLMLLHPVEGGTFTKPETMATARREQIVKFTAGRRGRKWKITSLAPMEFFAPPAAG